MDERQQALRDEPTGKLLLKFSIPAVIGMMLNSIYNIVDKLFIGNQADAVSSTGEIIHVGTLSLAGLNIAFPIQMLIIAIATMIGIGSASVISRNLGAKKFDIADRTFGNTIFLLFSIGALLTLLGNVFLSPLITLFGATDAIMPYSYNYLRIILSSTIIFSFTVGMNNIVRAEGNATMAMIVMIVGTVMNIPLDYLFVVVLKQGVSGAATATVLAQVMGFIIIAWYFLSGKSYFKLKKSMFRIDFKIIWQVLGIGLPSLVRTGAMALFSIVINHAIKTYGVDAHFAIMGVMMPIMSLIMMPSTGISQGMQPIVGYNFGAGQLTRVKETLSKSIITATVVSVVGGTLIMLFLKPIVGAFIQQSDTVDMGVKILRVVFLGIPTLGFQVVAGGYFQSVGKAAAALVVTASRQVLFLIPLILILTPKFGVDAIWWSMPIADYAACFLAIFWISWERRKEDREVGKS